LPGGGYLPHRAACAGDDEIGGGKRGSELVGKRKQLVVVACDPSAQAVVVALAAQVEDGGSRLAERFDGQLVEARSSLAAPEDEEDPRARRQVEDAAALGARKRPVPGRDRSAGDPVLRPVAPLDRKSEKHAA